MEWLSTHFVYSEGDTMPGLSPLVLNGLVVRSKNGDASAMQALQTAGYDAAGRPVGLGNPVGGGPVGVPGGGGPPPVLGGPPPQGMGGPPRPPMGPPMGGVTPGAIPTLPGTGRPPLSLGAIKGRRGGHNVPSAAQAQRANLYARMLRRMVGR